MSRNSDSYIFPSVGHITRLDREIRYNQKSFVIWLTGVPGSGKSTIGKLLEKYFFDRNLIAYHIDGDNIRCGISNDLDFSKKGRAENIRRASEISKLFADAGIITICSFVSPFKVDRLFARNLIGDDSFIETFVDAPFSVAKERDTKGLYKKAAEGMIDNFTGLHSAYEKPDNPEIHIQTALHTPEDSVNTIIYYLKRNKIIND